MTILRLEIITFNRNITSLALVLICLPFFENIFVLLELKWLIIRTFFIGLKLIILMVVMHVYEVVMTSKLCLSKNKICTILK